MRDDATFRLRRLAKDRILFMVAELGLTQAADTRGLLLELEFRGPGCVIVSFSC